MSNWRKNPSRREPSYIWRAKEGEITMDGRLFADLTKGGEDGFSRQGTVDLGRRA